MARRWRLFGKYVVFFSLLVTVALLASGLIEIYFSYQESKVVLSALQREKAQAAAVRIEGFITEIERQRRAGAVLVLPSPMVNSSRQQIIEIAARHRMPTIMAFPEFAEEGGLMAYGPDVAGMFRQAGDVAVRILRGAAPGEIPIERPARFELIVNRKTAASLGLTVPRSLLVRADKVIE